MDAGDEVGGELGKKRGGPRSPAEKSLLEGWLNRQSREVLVALAARMALRLVPLIAREGHSDDLQNFASTTFRSLAATWASTRYRTRAAEIQRSNFDAERFEGPVGVGAPKISSVARYAVYGAGLAETIAFSIPEYWDYDELVNLDSNLSEGELLNDIVFIEKNGLNSLMGRPLWSIPQPQWVTTLWTELRSRLDPRAGWLPWLSWYDRRITGFEASERHELIYCSVPESIWLNGIATGNAWLSRRLAEDINLETNETEVDNLQQKPALFNFELRDGRIALASESNQVEDEDSTHFLYSECRRKAEETLSRLERAQSDPRLTRNIKLLLERMARDLNNVQVGLIYSILLSLESDFKAYDTPEGRKEHAPDLIASLGDLSSTLRILLGQFPRARAIIANQIALGLTEDVKSLEAAQAAVDEFARLAESRPDLVDTPVVFALREPVEAANSRTLSEKAKHVALRILTAENFTRALIAIRELASDVAAESRAQLPKVTAKLVFGGTATAAALLLARWAGPEGLALLKDAALAIVGLKTALGITNKHLDPLWKRIFGAVENKPRRRKSK